MGARMVALAGGGASACQGTAGAAVGRERASGGSGGMCLCVCVREKERECVAGMQGGKGKRSANVIQMRAK